MNAIHMPRRVLFLALCAVSSTGAFVVQPNHGEILTTTTTRGTSFTQLHASSGDKNNKSSWVETATKTLASGFVAASLWSAPLPTALTTPAGQPAQNVNVAMAKEMASGSGSRVNKDAESLLRYGLPVKNKEVRLYHERLLTVTSDPSRIAW